MMNTLESAREEIDRIDRSIAELFEKRMKEAEKIAVYKRENGLDTEDQDREKLITERNALYVSGKYRGYYTEFLKNVIEESKKCQRDFLESGGKE